jgi:hypothetical protein
LADEPDEAGDMLSEALAVARRLAIGDEMQEAVRDLSENRVGAALARETQIAGDLQQVLDVLRNTAERRPEQLVDRLREAEDRLAALREQLAALRRQVAQAERMSAATPEQLAQLNEQQRRLRQQIEQLARQLDRLEAADASQSTGDAARKLNSRADGGSTQRQNASKPAPSNQVQQAESDLEQAANQLAARRQQAEDDLALEFVRRFQAELTDMVERQRQVVERTIDLDQAQSPASRPNDTAASQVAKLADEERQLAQLAKEHSEVLYGLGAVRVSLEDAERRLTVAADLLGRRETGQPAQQAERRALVRLEGMMQAFQQTATDAAQNPGAQPGAGQGEANEQPQRRPTFELLEVKMLRMLQVDLQQRTRDFQKRLTAAANRPPNQQDRAKLQQDAQELAAEQGRLAELVQNMLTRDNEPEE